MEGMIFDIRRSSINDGPGIRTVIFFKGCNLRCIWCHNPESLSALMQIQYYPSKCIGCGKCIELCPVKAHDVIDNNKVFLRELCILCEKCTSSCYAGALTRIGQKICVNDVVAEIKKDCLYYKNSGGGVTFSGGEPLLQPIFLKELLTECKKLDVHCAIETAVNVQWDTLLEVMPMVDLFICDVKIMDEKKHQEFTGVGNKQILANIKKLSEYKKDLWVRTPIIPGVNDNIQEISKIRDFVRSIATVKKFELLPYHDMAEEKYTSLGMQYKLRGLPSLKETSLTEQENAHAMS